jgi:lysozyme
MSNVAYFIDLSNDNGGVFDAKAYHAAGHRGVVLKASQGVGFVDGTYRERYAAAVAEGLWVGAYHFADSSGLPDVQAKNFEEAIKGTSPRYRILDEEQESELANPVVFREEFEAVSRVDWLYSDEGYLEQYGEGLRPTGGGIWAAAYPNLTKGWWSPCLRAHQYADTAIVDGVPGQCDISFLL